MPNALIIPEDEYPADMPAQGYLNGLQSIICACACAVSSNRAGSRLRNPDLSASSCGGFAQRFKDDYADFNRGVRRKYPGITSPGIGYTESTLRVLEGKGFFSGPAVCLYCQDLTDEMAKDHLTPIKSVFEQAGISCAWTNGAAFPDDEPFLCLTIDTHAPAFLDKIKQVYLKHYPEYKGRNLGQIAMDYRGGARQVKGLLHRLHQLAMDVGAEKDFVGKTIALGLASREDFEGIEGALDYDMNFVRTPMLAFDEHLNAEEKADVIVRMAAALAKAEIDRNNPTKYLAK